MSILRKLKYFFYKYRDAILISFGTGLLLLIISEIVKKLLGETPLNIIIVIGVTLIILLLAMLFNQKRLFNTRFERINNILTTYFGFSIHENQYFSRLGHFALEKQVLARTFVEKVLPKLAHQICQDYPHLKQLNIILDSGTTITPIFKHLILYGIPIDKSNVGLKIYTNNLSGIDELHKIEYLHLCKLKERDFSLLGGMPLNRYRATTGDDTEHCLDAIGETQKKSNDTIVTVGVITANWFLGGHGLNNISICARGERHLEFKKKVIETSEYVVLIGPLGKILKLEESDINILNRMYPPTTGSQYDCYCIPPKMKNVTYLLTSYRPNKSLSPLKRNSGDLQYIRERNSATNYILCLENPYFNPPGTTKMEVETIEMPHQITRDYPEVFFGNDIITN